MHSKSVRRGHLVASAVDAVQNNLGDHVSINPLLSQTTGSHEHSSGAVIVNINVAR
jgi:hypothetical protein